MYSVVLSEVGDCVVVSSTGVVYVSVVLSVVDGRVVVLCFVVLSVGGGCVVVVSSIGVVYCSVVLSVVYGPVVILCFVVLSVGGGSVVVVSSI